MASGIGKLLGAWSNMLNLSTHTHLNAHCTGRVQRCALKNLLCRAAREILG